MAIYPNVSNEKLVVDIKRLLRQLTKNQSAINNFNRGVLNRILFGGNGHIAVIKRKDKVIAMGTVFIVQTSLKRLALIEDVVVDKKYRGRGLGKTIVQALIQRAKDFHADCIDLTSHPSRIEANSLYRHLGFEKRDTNCYRLKSS